MKIFAKIILLSLTLTCLGWSTWAAGISVTPSRLTFKQTEGVKKSAYFQVRNLAGEPAIFNLYVDEFADQISLEPDNFRLEPDELIKVKATVMPKAAGLFATNISIVAQDLDRRKFNVATGVKIPLQITSLGAEGKGWNDLLIKAGVAASLAIVLMFIIYLLGHRKKKWPERLEDSVDLLFHHRRLKWTKIFKFLRKK
ncbi:MAG: hypothetical protein COU22_01585 [Candidatus Komeilibacteria bacterium CG10_big_fil_rev_8_21_14_0_10_41_13]|uniref:CARDB domain-containing protein n=1 Tax=Candidatus Komeilibacteria bacterium CG10_big_fil_rev_8_21_14_0_10_41_13 TaxID=1974476 RepID=A0A2M6WCL7_9BACT|nr:MAG: hypothetical protein COU22_01585 [Candidatus Komeilibacteria bacterium CG10_big_fil_rev_8_21_14_0_10_41_13]